MCCLVVRPPSSRTSVSHHGLVRRLYRHDEIQTAISLSMMSHCRCSADGGRPPTPNGGQKTTTPRATYGIS
eukprot:scaffold85209_cov34-Tisochrysis_lutea.AAC.2